jgi:penicillin-binding protein 1C
VKIGFLRAPRGRNAGLFLIPAALAYLCISFWVVLGPLPSSYSEGDKSQSLRIYDRNGFLLYEVLSKDDVRKNWLQPGSIPPLVEGAAIAAEDHRFFKHNGIDPVAVLRALWVDMKSLSLKEGGSTITQQVAKRLMKRRSRGLFAKFRETVYAVRLETRLSKKEILALYFNLAPYGKNCEGIIKASEIYFGCSPEKLTPAQSAYLASLPKAPSKLDPAKNPDELKKRQARVLNKMEELGYISNETLQRALDEKISVTPFSPPFSAPHFVERVKEELPKDFTGNVVTTLNVTLQNEVERIVRSNKKLLEKIGANNVAVVVLDNRRGEWLAWEGSGCYGSDENGGAIDGVVSPRQPGSALKPFLYALAFEGDYSPASILPDIMQSYETAKSGVYYKPRNYDNKFRGPLSARKSLGGSVNVPAVYILSKVGVNSFIELLKNGGITTIDKSVDYYGYGLALGNAEVRLDEVTALYSALARGGNYMKPVKLIGVQKEESRRIFSYEASYQIADILSDPMAREFAFGRNSLLDFPYKIAAKTGTSEGYHDNWAFGYNEDITVGVWVGNFSRDPLKYSSGISGAGPIFHEVMENALMKINGMEPLPDKEILERPGGFQKTELCSLSGCLAGAACPSKYFEYLPQKKIPAKCSWHLSYKGRVYVRYPQPFDEWARSMGISTAVPEQALALNAFEKNEKEFAISSPLPNSAFLFDPTLKPPYQGVYLETRNGEGEIEWTIDGRPFGKSKNKIFWPFARGEHIIKAKDSENTTDSVKVVVK